MIPVVALKENNRYKILVTQCHINKFGSLLTNQNIKYQNPNPNTNPIMKSNIILIASIILTKIC